MPDISQFRAAIGPFWNGVREGRGHALHLVVARISTTCPREGGIFPHQRDFRWPIAFSNVSKFASKIFDLRYLPQSKGEIHQMATDTYVDDVVKILNTIARLRGYAGEKHTLFNKHSRTSKLADAAATPYA